VAVGVGEELRRRRRFFHVVNKQSDSAHRVDVAAERSVDELKIDARCDFVDHRVLVEVTLDAPVVLGVNAVVDPTAARCLEEWMAEEQ
jgi:hypothetical protein